MEKRIFFNVDNNKLYVFDQSHTIFKANNKDILCKNFDYYIRGIISENVLYLRAYYPYSDINELTYNDLMTKSNKLLTMFKDDILKALTSQNIQIDNVKLNVNNTELKEYLNNPYV